MAQDPEQLRKNVIFCRGCTKFLPSSEFSLAVNTRVVRLCRHCKELDNEAQQREDFSCYKNILKHLCKDESELNPDAKIPYLLQVVVDTIYKEIIRVNSIKTIIGDASMLCISLIGAGSSLPCGCGMGWSVRTDWE